MASATYTYQRGETISIALDLISGSTGDVSAISSKLRKLDRGRKTLDASAPVAATFVPSTRSAVGETPAGWTLTIDAATSAELAAGSYVADARLTVAGGTITADPVIVVITEPATVS